jgi:pyruvate-formate lyase-activating enzyme
MVPTKNQRFRLHDHSQTQHPLLPMKPANPALLATVLARFIAAVRPDIPWHVTAFHPDYRMTSAPATSVRQLVRAAEIGAEEGLHFVYAGNLSGRVGPWEHTWCP